MVRALLEVRTAVHRMESALSDWCPKMVLWRRVGLVWVVLVVALLALDITVHMSKNTKAGDSIEKPKARGKRSVARNASVRLGAPDVQNETPIPTGAVFTVWGRSVCPPSSLLVYKGVMGSGSSTHTGGGAEYLCLTDEPEWIRQSRSKSDMAMMYGVEYQTNYLGIANGQNGVCAVCQSSRRNKLMIPGRKSCVAGWTREYYGYLMGSNHKEPSNRNFICVDLNPEADRAGYQADGGGKLWHVESYCGSLPCPKYHDGGEMTCVVCTR